jgi:hypothetical protein
MRSVYLAFNIVKPSDIGSCNKTGWVKVTTTTNKIGYVKSEDLHSSIDFRLILRSDGTQWKIVALLAGD